MVDAALATSSPDLVLALTAWPQGPAVVSETGVPACALYEREETLAVARSRLAGGDPSLEGWLAACGAEALDDVTRQALTEGAGRAR